MPFFKSNKDIFLEPWNEEVFNENWMDSNTLILPSGGPNDLNNKWDYKRELSVEDIEIWEQIYYQGGGLGLYAAWLPYAEFYMITKHLFMYLNDGIETFYGELASKKAYKRAIELGMPVHLNKIWVSEEDAWLYQKKQAVNIVVL